MNVKIQKKTQNRVKILLNVVYLIGVLMEKKYCWMQYGILRNRLCNEWLDGSKHLLTQLRSRPSIACLVYVAHSSKINRQYVGIWRHHKLGLYRPARDRLARDDYAMAVGSCWNLADHGIAARSSSRSVALRHRLFVVVSLNLGEDLVEFRENFIHVGDTETQRRLELENVAIGSIGWQ